MAPGRVLYATMLAAMAACDADDIPAGGRELGMGKRLLADLHCESGRQVTLETACSEPVYVKIHTEMDDLSIDCPDDPSSCPIIIFSSTPCSECEIPFVCPASGHVFGISYVMPETTPYTCTTKVTKY